jgi:hypothetical protein
MSVQLIVYPQGHKGVYNQFSNPSFNFVVNGQNFTGLDNTPTKFGSSIPLSLFISPPVIPNSWYRFAYFGSTFPYVYPTQVNNNLLITTDGSGTVGGVYQRITGLTIGVQYQVIINIQTPPQASYNGTIRVFTQRYGFQPAYTSNYAIDENTTQVIHLVSPLTQVGTVDTVLFVGYVGGTDNCTIGSIEMIPLSYVSGSILLDDGQVICDLYEDEDIPLTLSVDEFKNVAEKPQSYSKAFNLPATKRNNRIFDHIFEITRHLDGGSPQFNPYQKTQCVLKQDGLLIFQGYLRMLDIVDKEGEISYNVNLYSEVVALADLLKDKKFSDLSFTELEHEYDRIEIERSNYNGVAAGQTTPITYLNPSTSGFRTNFNTIKYPFIDWNRQWVVANGSTPTATEGFIELTNLEQAFRPCISIKYLIDLIFEQPDIPFTYTSAFLNTTEFSELFMDFNWGEGNAPVNFNSRGELTRTSSQSLTTSYTTLDFQNMIGTTISPNFGYSSGVFTAQEDGQVYEIFFNMEFETNLFFTETLDVQWLINGVANTALYNQTVTSSGHTYSGNFITTPPLSAGDTILCQAKSSGAAMSLESGLSGGFTLTYDALITATTNVAQTTSSTLLQTLRGELGQWDFLKGLITMFNLVTLPDKNNPNNIIIEPYVDTFINNTSNELNWTDKIDISEMKLEPLTDLNRNTLFKYVEDEDDYAFQNFKEATSGFLYGSREYDATNEFNILEGTEEVEASPFAATVIKSIDARYANFVTPAMYSVNDDGVSEPFENSPRIFYNRGLNSSVSYYIPAQNGQTYQQAVTYGYFSHLRKAGSTLTGARDLNFGLQQLLPNVLGGTINNLYNLYWADYFNELYNINTRIMTIKINLTPADINTFKFNQKVMIKNRLFRVNKIDYKPNDLSNVEFILIPSLGNAS